MLEIENLVKYYGRFKAVDGLSLKVEEGSIFGFVGPNGAGKTTTLKIVSGLLTATSGSVRIGGIDIIKTPLATPEKIGYVPDFFGVYDNLRVDEYMEFFAGCYSIPVNERNGLVEGLLELVNLLDKKKEYVDSLSRGMKQRLCLARALIHDPDVLILDEPASGLDPRARIEVKEILKQLKTLGKTVIISSHILPELAEICTEVGIIDKGRLVDSGTINEIMSRLYKSRMFTLKTMDKLDEAEMLLRENPYVIEVVRNVEDISFSFNGDDVELSNITASFIKNGIPLITFKEEEGNLEDIFMQLTKGDSENEKLS